MSIGISISINVNEIDKARLYQGAKGKYLDVTCFINDKVDEYGNRGMVTQSVGQDERAAGVRGNILGNVKVFTGTEVKFIPRNSGQAQAPAQAPAAQDDEPF
jgi:hypothetical protein